MFVFGGAEGGLVIHWTVKLSICSTRTCPVLPLCRGDDNFWQVSACDKALNSHSFWLCERPISWDCSAANSASGVTLRDFVCSQSPETVNLYSILNINQNVIACVPFTNAGKFCLLAFGFLCFYKKTGLFTLLKRCGPL